MNPEHLKALLTLRYQLSRNQIKKAGAANAVLSVVLVVFALMASISMFFSALIVGILFLPDTTPGQILIVWNIVVAVFLAVWLIGLLVELQQVEYLSLDKLLHLPITLREAFFLNYTSSYLNTAVVMFVPMLVGLTIAMIVVRGASMLLIPPLLIAFLFFVTTVTFQFRGWLARLMENKRRRGTILVVMTMTIVLLSQIPNAITMRQDRLGDGRRTLEAQLEANQRNNLGKYLDSELAAGQINQIEKSQQLAELEARITADRLSRLSSQRESLIKSLGETAQAVDLVFPPGWLPYAVFSLEENRFGPVWLAIAGMFLLGSASLYLTYRNTVRSYTGFQAARPKSRRSSTARISPVPNLMLRELPFLTDHQATITLGAFLGLLRAPETKMALLLPMIIGVIFGSMLITLGKIESPEWARPIIAMILYLVTMFGMSQIIFNMFGTDRGGFRAYVLSPFPRRDILIGKNFATAPFGAGLCLALLAIFQITNPMKFTHLAATLIQLPTTLMLVAILGNGMSIFFPFGIARGTMKPAQLKASTIVATMLALSFSVLLCFPAIMLAGIEVFFSAIFQISVEPFYLIASILELILVVWLYTWAINIQANWLQRNETRVLELVANVPE